MIKERGAGGLVRKQKPIPTEFRQAKETKANSQVKLDSSPILAKSRLLDGLDLRIETKKRERGRGSGSRETS